MNTTASIVIGAALGLAACGGSPAAGTTTPPAHAPTTFAEQVSAGGALYGAHCASCHGDAGQGTDHAPRVVGLADGALPLDPPASRQIRHTQFRTVADVADFAVHDMPKDAPGSLQPDEYWAILAFDLHANDIDLPQPLDATVAATLTIPRP